MCKEKIQPKIGGWTMRDIVSRDAKELEQWLREHPAADAVVRMEMQERLRKCNEYLDESAGEHKE